MYCSWCVFFFLGLRSHVFHFTSVSSTFLRKHWTACWNLPDYLLKTLWEWPFVANNNINILYQWNCLSWHFLGGKFKQIMCLSYRPLLTKCLKMQLKTVSLLNWCHVWTQHPWVRCLIHRSVSSCCSIIVVIIIISGSTPLSPRLRKNWPNIAALGGVNKLRSF